MPLTTCVWQRRLSSAMPSLPGVTSLKLQNKQETRRAGYGMHVWCLSQVKQKATEREQLLHTIAQQQHHYQPDHHLT